MKKLTTILALVCVMISSCTIEKRHYMSGYHVEWNHRVKANTAALAQTVEEPQRNFQDAAVMETTAAEALPAETSVKEEIAIPVAQIPASGEKKITRSRSAHNEHKVERKNEYRASRKLLRSDFSSYGQMSLEERNLSRIDDILLLILALFISPLAVYLHEGNWNTACWINLILWLCLIVPGIIHAFIVILL